MRTFLPRIFARLQVSLTPQLTERSGDVQAFRTPEQNLTIETLGEFRSDAAGGF
jgi:hypothetical protein